VKVARFALGESWEKLKGQNMQRIIVTAAAMLLGGGLAVTTAKADMNYGPVVDQAKGLCFQKTTNTDPGFFGYWTECPKPASSSAAASTTTVHHRHIKHIEKDDKDAQ
jgi:hypothetical protein